MKYAFNKRLILLFIFGYLLASSAVFTQIAYGDSVADDAHDVIIGDHTKPIKILEPTTNKVLDSRNPIIVSSRVSGELNKNKRGVDFYKGIKIDLIGSNLSDDNFLTPEGLYWSKRTYVELIQGKSTGLIGSDTFGSMDSPIVPVPAFSINKGDKGRINFVGKTKSGLDLDLLWTVIDSDTEDWIANSGFATRRGVSGLAFTGEQNMLRASGNSIAVLYNVANRVNLHYQIVKHGTFIEQPVVLSFIITDIDAGQGVKTDLANIVQIVPEESKLKIFDDIIYDSQSGVVELHGSVDLPKGGYLGAGFVSNFNYMFYSPAPKRMADSYKYANAVRYDIFGSSLQAKLSARIQQNTLVRYVDDTDKTIKPSVNYQGYTDETYKFSPVHIKDYKLIRVQKDLTDINNPELKFIYKPKYKIRIQYLDERGKVLASEQKFSILKGDVFRHSPPEIKGYIKPNDYKTVLLADGEYAFIYKKIVIPTPIPTKKPVVNKQNITLGSNNSVFSTVIENKPYSGVHNVYKAPSVSFKYKAIRINLKKRFIKKIFDTGRFPKDPFLVNTGMLPDDKKNFLTYIDAVALQAKRDGKNVDHAVANAVAYPVYSSEKLQKLVNDFGEEPDLSNYSDVQDVLKELHGDKGRIDFPHLGMTFASVEDSGIAKGLVKKVAGLSIDGGTLISNEEVFFQNNSLQGDLATNINVKDRITDIDAYILRNHSQFQNMPLNEKIRFYYGIEDLDKKRENYYKEALATQGAKLGLTDKEYSLFLLFVSSLSLSGIVLLAKDRNFKVVAKEYIQSWRGLPGLLVKLPILVLNIAPIVTFKIARFIYKKLPKPYSHHLEKGLDLRFTGFKHLGKGLKSIGVGIKRSIKVSFKGVKRAFGGFKRLFRTGLNLRFTGFASLKNLFRK